MLTFTADSNTTSLYDGTINVERSNSAEGVTPVVRTGQVTTAGITEASLLDNGAVRATARLSYNGDDEFLVRFRVLIDEFNNHSNVGGGQWRVPTPGAASSDPDRILVLWQDANGTWWDIRRSQIGNAQTGGVRNPFKLADGSNAYEADGGVISIKLNKDTVSQYATVNLYIVVLSEPRPDVTNPTQRIDPGYMITYYAELPDRFAGHFHGYEILASASAPIVVE
jgi:hypothetical protein